MGDVCDAASRNETASLSEESEDTVIVSFVINIGIGEGIEGAAALTCARDGGDVTPSPHFGNKDDTAWEGGERSIGIGGAAALTCARDGGRMPYLAIDLILMWITCFMNFVKKPF